MPPEGYKPSYAGAFAKAGHPPADTAARPISRPQIYREADGNNAVLANVAIDLNNRPDSASLAEVALTDLLSGRSVRSTRSNGCATSSSRMLRP
jgi:hypothetical protein